MPKSRGGDLWRYWAPLGPIGRLTDAVPITRLCRLVKLGICVCACVFVALWTLLWLQFFLSIKWARAFCSLYNVLTRVGRLSQIRTSATSTGVPKGRCLNTQFTMNRVEPFRTRVEVYSPRPVCVYPYGLVPGGARRDTPRCACVVALVLAPLGCGTTCCPMVPRVRSLAALGEALVVALARCSGWPNGVPLV